MLASGFNNIKNFLFRQYLRRVYSPNFTAAKSIRHQQQLFHSIISRLANTQLGRDLKFGSIQSYSQFRTSVPVTQYDFYEPYIEQIKAGAQNVMTDKPVRWFAKTSGTTSGKSKLVPITKEVMRQCHVRGSFFALSKIHQLSKSLHLLSHKNLLIPGGIYEVLPNGIVIGDISAILSRNIPPIYRRYYTPGIQVQTLGKWEEKINRTVQEVKHEDVGTFSGVPTWHLAMLNRLKEETGFTQLSQLWKNLQVFFHGGVSFEPYRQQFKDLIGRDDFIFFEIYNATEGFIAIQETLHTTDLLLLTDNLLFFEFIPLDKYYTGDRNALSLSEVQTGVPYVLLLTAPNGLIRYQIGDVITFTKTDPYTFKITGRTQEYINAFGEDLLLANVQNALMKTNVTFNCSVRDFTVAPFYINIEQKGRIQFAIEFNQPPVDIQQYAAALDENLKQENSNYLQKRTNNLALSQLEVIALPEGTFYKWLSSKNKLGGQNKVPKLVNGRVVIEEILQLF